MPPRRARTKTTVGMASVPSDGALPISLHGARRRKTVGRVVQNQHPIRATGWRGEAQPIPLLDDADRTGNACARIIPVAGQMLSREPGEIHRAWPAHDGFRPPHPTRSATDRGCASERAVSTATRAHAAPDLPPEAAAPRTTDAGQAWVAAQGATSTRSASSHTYAHAPPQTTPSRATCEPHSRRGS